jgi:hypothetical protein
LPENIPVIVAGKGSGTLKGGQHLMHKGMPLANLHVSLMEKFGVHVDKLGNSTGKVEELAGV